MMRTIEFKKRTHNRYWWYHLADSDYIPPVFSALADEEWALMDDWFTDTEAKFPSPGEISVPGLSMLNGIVSGNGIGAMVQLGHYVGFSTLMLGFALRRMGRSRALFSIDINAEVTVYTQEWVDRAGLRDVVRLQVGDSADPAMASEAAAWLGRAPQLVFIDSSHQYHHTLEELDLWYDRMAPGGLLSLHDTSAFAQTFDSTGTGGVLRAAREWGAGRNMILLNNFVGEQHDSGATDHPSKLTYKDGCGFGLVQKPF